MGKADFMSPKAVANRQKSKGLQKLRWYCQVCQKQCRDENGFKCHTSSEAHLRQMAVFGENAGRVISDYSSEFESRFLELISVSHRNTRVAAQLVYNEYIADKEHVHMNATKWTTLTGFIHDLARRNVVELEDTPKGYYITYKPKDAEEALRDAKNLKRERAEEQAEAREERLLAEAVHRAKQARLAEDARGGSEAGAQPSELQPRAEGELLRVSLMPTARPRPLPLSGLGGLGGGGAAAAAAAAPAAPPLAPPPQPAAAIAVQPPPVGSGGALAAIIAAERAAKDAAARRAQEGQPWLLEGIVVKVVARELASQGFYKAKGCVRSLCDNGFGAEVELLPSGAADGAPPRGGELLRLDQQHLETVLPQPGGAVRVLRGACRGSLATLLGVDVERFKARLRVRTKGEFEGAELELDYEEVCKCA